MNPKTAGKGVQGEFLTAERRRGQLLCQGLLGSRLQAVPVALQAVLERGAAVGRLAYVDGLQHSRFFYGRSGLLTKTAQVEIVQLSCIGGGRERQKSKQRARNVHTIGLH